jgi:voltage-gated potassium channel
VSRPPSAPSAIAADRPSIPEPQALRDRYNAFVAAHEVAWELTFAAVAVAFIVVGFLAENEQAENALHYTAMEVVLTLVLGAEFVTRLAASRDRRAYLRGHWIDAVALIPTVRGVRLIRLLRLLRLVRVFAGVYRGLSSIERLANHRGLIWLFCSWLTVAMICSAVLFVAENGINENITTPWDAIWWGIVTLTTVGYGDVYPITPEGRVAAAALMILGITLFAAITGTITSFIVSAQQADQPPSSVGDRIRELARLRDEGLITQDEFDTRRTVLIDQL